MELPWVRVILFSAFSITDVGVAVYYRYMGDTSSKVGSSLHADFFHNKKPFYRILNERNRWDMQLILVEP